jgi:hypothetical membrane protein
VEAGIENRSNVSAHDSTNWLALGAIAGPVLFVLAFIVLGLSRPGYSAVRQSVSALGIGPNGGLMDAAFVLGALFIFAGVIGINQFIVNDSDTGVGIRRLCAILLAIPPLGMLWAGVFNMHSLTLHTIGAGVAFTAPALAFLLAGIILRRIPRRRGIGDWVILASPLTMAILIGFITSAPIQVLQSVGGGGTLGIWERVLIFEVFMWYTILGWLALHVERTRRNKPGSVA